MLLTFLCSIIFSICAVTWGADCSIEDVYSLNGTSPVYHVSDNFIGVVKQLQTENITVAYVEDPLYIDVTLEDNILTIRTTDKFADYEKEQSSQSIKLKIKTICNGVSYINSLGVYFDVDDTNTYEPTFNSNHYTYTFFGEVPNTIDITDFGSLYVTDYDIGNSYMTFEIEDSEYLKISNSYKDTSEKDYSAKLETTKLIKGPLNVTYTITATDSGTPNKSSSANVTLIVISPNDIAFTESMYVAFMKENGELFMQIGPINIENFIGSDLAAAVNVSVEDDYIKHFNIYVSTSIKLVAKDVNSLVCSVGNKTGIIVKLIASTESTTIEGSVYIDLSGIPRKCECSVDLIDNLNLIYQNPNDITDTYVGVIERLEQVNLDEAYFANTTYLEAHLDNDFLVISTTLDYMDYEDKTQDDGLSATLVTKCADDTSELTYIVYIIDTNNHQPKFEREHYSYMFYDNVTISPDFDINQYIEIAATDKDLTNTNITFKIEENDYLSLEYGGKTVSGSSRYFATLSLKRNISFYFNKTFQITATDDGKPPLSSTATLSLEVLRAKAPLFTESLYTAYLTEDRKIIVTNGPIALKNITSFDDLIFDIALEYDNYFTIAVDDEIKITVKKSSYLSGLINPDNTTLLISLYAEGLSPEIYAESSLLLDMYVLLDIIETTEVVDTTQEPQSPGSNTGALDNWLGVSLGSLILIAALFSGIIGGFALILCMIGLAKRRDGMRAPLVVNEKR